MVTLSSMILCQILTQSPVTSVQDVSTGLFICGILSEYTHENNRFYPEIIAFLTSSLHVFLPTNKALLPQLKKNCLSTFKYENFSFVRSRKYEGNTSSSTAIPWSFYHQKVSQQLDISQFTSHLENLYISILSLIQASIIDRYSKHSSFPELIDPIYTTLTYIRPHDKPSLSKNSQKKHLEILEIITVSITTIKKNRIPLQWRKATSNSTETLAPKFETNYNLRKDADTDKDRSKLKQLTRQLKREQKAAMRELRRDSAFIEKERSKELRDEHEKRRAERVKNYAWLEDQQATINLQVKKGKGLLKGGGSGVAKKPRLRR